MTIFFETNVTDVGPEAINMISEAGMFILFGEGAPSDLAEFCFTIDSKDLHDQITVGSKLVIDGISYPITSVGNLVQKNLSELGHITIALDGSNEDSLPGTLHVSAPQLNTIKVGSVIQFIN